jgi:hypothetical protein
MRLVRLLMKSGQGTVLFRHFIGDEANASGRVVTNQVTSSATK